MAIVPSFEDILAKAFDQVRASAEVNVAILVRMLGALDTIGSLTIRPGHLRALDEQLQCIAEVADRCIESSYERARIEQRLTEVREKLQTVPAMNDEVEKV